MSTLGWLLVGDGLAFVLIGVLVLILPSPQPALTAVVHASDLVPFTDTRRLLATQFIGAGLIALLVGTVVHDPGVLRLVALARVATLVLVIAVNASQLRNGAWKAGPLRVLVAVFGVLAVGYLVLTAIG